jgi:menaquinone-dependent protoporphyrinogen IX oxidase
MRPWPPSTHSRIAVHLPRTPEMQNQKEDVMCAETTQPRILVAFATEHGSTARVAEVVAEELRVAGAVVEVCALSQNPDPRPYDSVIVGAPMIMGWHRKAVRYVRMHEATLAGLPTAYFATALSLTRIEEQRLDGTALVADPALARRPRHPGRLTWREKYALPMHYLGGAFRKAPSVRPVSVAFFGGALDPARLNLWQRLFVTGVVRAEAGDRRNWEFIHEWGRSLFPLILAAAATPAGADGEPAAA